LEEEYNQVPSRTKWNILILIERYADWQANLADELARFQKPS
jgi:hypothetical protein